MGIVTDYKDLRLRLLETTNYFIDTLQTELKL